MDDSRLGINAATFALFGMMFCVNNWDLLSWTQLINDVLLSLHRGPIPTVFVWFLDIIADCCFGLFSYDELMNLPSLFDISEASF